MNPVIFPTHGGAEFIQKRADTTTHAFAATTTITITTTKTVTNAATVIAAGITASATTSVSFANNATQRVTFPNPTTLVSITSTSSLPYNSLTNLNPTTTDPLRSPTDSFTGSATDLPVTANTTADPSSGSPISSGSIAGIVVGVFAAAAIGLAAILFIKRKGAQETRRRQKDATYSHRVSSFGQSEFFAGPSVPPPPMMTTSMTYGSAPAPIVPTLAAGPTNYYFNQQPNATYIPQLYSPQLYTTAVPGSGYTQQQHQSASSPPPPSPSFEDLWNHSPQGTFTVASTYIPTLDDEIYIQPGDQVHVYTEYDDGWCLGINISRDNTRGVFPKHCLLPSSPTAPNRSEGFGRSKTNLNRQLSNRESSLYSGGD